MEMGKRIAPLLAVLAPGVPLPCSELHNNFDDSSITEVCNIFRSLILQLSHEGQQFEESEYSQFCKNSSGLTTRES